MQLLKRLHYLLLVFIVSCGSSDDFNPEPELSIQAASSISIIDVANSGDASDFEIKFILGAENITSLRLFIVKESEASTFDLTKAESVSAGSYAEVSKFTRTVRPVKTILDINGDPIEESLNYVVFILSIAEPETGLENLLSNASASVELKQISAVSTLTDFINSGSGGMDADKDGNIYMGDFGVTLNGGGQNVFLITPEGEVSIFARGMNGASGNDFDSEGNLFQSNITGGYISKITPNGTVTTFVSGIQSTIGIVIDSEGTLFVAACNNRIWKITADGTATVFSTSSLLSCPNGIEMDAAGNIYTCNFNDGRIIKLTPDGTASVFANIPGNNNGHLLFNNGRFYIAARGANQIYTVDLSGNPTLFAGSGIRGLDNGTLNNATFSLPNDLAFSPDGKKLYINDKDPKATGNTISPVVIRVIDIVQ